MGNWKRQSLYYAVAKNLEILSSALMWKAENVPNELGDAVPEISKQCCSFHFVSLLLIVKLQDKLKAGLVNKKSEDLLFLKIPKLFRWHTILKLRNGF